MKIASMTRAPTQPVMQMQMQRIIHDTKILYKVVKVYFDPDPELDRPLDPSEM